MTGTDETERRKTKQLPFLWIIAACLASFYIKLLWLTCRREFRVPKEVRRMLDTGKPVILLFWHGRIVMMPKAKPHNYRVNFLSSLNKAGSFTEKMTAPFNIGTVRGSARDKDKPGKDKGGFAALKGLLSSLKNNVSVGITPDGPRGPRMRMTEGAVLVAKLSGRPMVPVTFSCRTGFNTKGWDRMLLPVPFTSNVILFGDPIFVPRESSAAAVEEFRLNAETVLNGLTRKADTDCGRAPVLPADVSPDA